MIRLQGLRLSPGHDGEELRKKAAGLLRVPKEAITSVRILRRSLDARDKADIRLVYSLALTLAGEEKILKKSSSSRVSSFEETDYRFPCEGPGSSRPVIVGAGPAGLFCAYELARVGFSPILLEMGEPADQRKEKVERFWATGKLDTKSNVQFGEGGAGTFSDGKLSTGNRDREGRMKEVLETFVRLGAPEEILFDAKPHLGTDVLVSLVTALRKEIIRLGGEVRFQSKMTDLRVRNGKVAAVCLENGEEIETESLVLAIGHSGRETFRMLHANGIPMESKAFAVGFRAEHPQRLINLAQYGKEETPYLPPADYKLIAHDSQKRAVYSFCMCPGGYIVDASSEEGRLVVNGMSYSGRAGNHANSAIVASVTPEDVARFVRDDSIFAGLRFQEELERSAYLLCQGKIPAQSVPSFLGSGKGDEIPPGPSVKGSFEKAALQSLLPGELNERIRAATEEFGRRIPGFDGPEAVFFGIESRTSSPVRILRGEDGQSPVSGLYPCGEGAGYAGGIMSAAVDGIRVAEKIAKTLQMC